MGDLLGHWPMIRTYPKTLAWWESAQRATVCGSQTNSKAWSRYTIGATPGCIVRGQGSHVWDLDGHEFIDWQCALGAATIGHGNPAVASAILAQIARGTISTPLPTELEQEVSEQFCSILGWPETAKWFKTGSEACACATRAARRATGRDLILTPAGSYHGWLDWTIARTDYHPGVPSGLEQDIDTFAYDDLASLETAFIGRNVAAVILEPTLVEQPSPGFLEGVWEIAHKHGALVIHDNMILGGRMALGGGDEYFHVQPDLSVFGKAIAGGMPLACVVGKHDLMRMTDTCSGTFGGENPSLAACQTTLRLYQSEGLIAWIWAAGQAMMDAATETVKALHLPATVKGWPFRPVITWEHPDKIWLESLVMQECADRGLLHHYPSLMPSSAMTETDIKQSVAIYRLALGAIADALKAGMHKELLRGPCHIASFARPEPSMEPAA